VIVNAVPPAGCTRCGGSVGDASALKDQFDRYAMIKAPAVFPPPRGVQRLAEWVQSWERATA
jgi:hypothetical protein